MTDFVEVFRPWNAGRSQVQISEALGIDRKTIRKYLAPAPAPAPAPALAEALATCSEEFDEQVWRARIARWLPELVDPAARALTWPQIAVHHQWIDGQLKVPVTVSTIAQRLRDDHGVEVSESTVRRYIATTFAEERLEANVMVPRGAVEPGSEAQIDYGKLGMWLDPASGLRVAVWVFAMILSCSRALFVQPVPKMDQRSWNASHVAAFEFFGGFPAWLVTENVPRNIFGHQVGRGAAEDAEDAVQAGEHTGCGAVPKRDHHPVAAPRKPRHQQHDRAARDQRPVGEIVLQPQPGLGDPGPVHTCIAQVPLGFDLRHRPPRGALACLGRVSSSRVLVIG